MSSAVVFRTPGLIDLRSFTVMGFNAKPTKPNAIGVFGTGLKYSVAVLLRLGASIVVYRGRDKYTFFVKKVDFRGKSFEQVWMRSERWKMRARNTELPFTTEYGKNWLPWMVFRELHSNTLDENGTTFLCDTRDGDGWLIDGSADDVGPGEDHTLIIVSGSDEFVKAYRERDQIFVDLSNKKVLGTISGVEIREGTVNQLFYQGLRAKDLNKPALLTYNFTSSHDLTEDRQLAHDWQVKRTLANAIATSDDERLIERVITADNKHWEHDLAPDDWVAPSAAFHRVMMRRPRSVGFGWGGYYTKHDTRPEAVKASLWDDALRPWEVKDEVIVAADGKRLFAMPHDMNKNTWAALAERLCKEALSRVGTEPPARVMIDEDIWPEGEGPFAREPYPLTLTTYERGGPSDPAYQNKENDDDGIPF